MLRRLISGGPGHRSRLHDGLGNRVGAGRMLRNAPRALASGIGRIAFGRRPVAPWISYDAQRDIAALLTPASRVLEFGSGMSTVWLAARAGRVVSIEGFRPWFDKVSALLAEKRLGNVTYHFADGDAAYAQPPEAECATPFDFILVDGNCRDLCVERALPLLAPGGALFLDNSDRHAPEPGNREGDMPRARALLAADAEATGATITAYTDFVPTLFFVTQGLLLRRPAR